MKKNYTAKVIITLLLGVLASTFAVYASTPMKNFPINKNPLYGGMYVVAASTFSIEDAESSTELSTFPMSDVVVYPNSATLTMDAAYTEKSSNFGTGGTAAAPNYAVTNVASNITTSFNFGTSDKNYLYFHAPKSQGKVLAISTEHKANTDVYFKTTISLVAGSKTKLELWMGPAGETVKVADYEFNKGGQKTQWDISEYLYENSAAVSGSTIVFEIHPCDWLNTPFSGTERANSLAPYCGMSDACDEMLKLSGKYWPYQLSMVYRFSGSLPNLLMGKFGSMDRSLKGWKPMEGILDTVGIKAEEYPFPIDRERVALLERFITDCQQHHIRLIMIESPMYVCSEQDVFKFPRELAAKYHIPFIDHYRDTDFVGHAELFYDFGHFNRKGAEQYSAKTAQELKAIIGSPTQ